MEIKTTAGVRYCKQPCSGYLYPDDSCLTSCQSPLVTESTGSTQYCKSSCPSDYIYPDGSCVANCQSPLEIETTAGILYCKNSCTGYLYPDNSCLASCQSPFVVESTGGIQYCKSSCPNDYIYPDGSCHTDCEAPLEIETTAGVKYCKSPCLNDYIDSDDSCVADCESPLKVESVAGVQYCKNPCEGTSDYLYADGSCDDTCPVPLSEKTENEIKYCYNPCSESDTYLASNQQCQTTCSSPSTIKTDTIAKYCVFPCENLDYYYHEKTGECQATCDSPNTAVDSPLPKICKTPTPEGGDPESEENDASFEKSSKIKNIGNTVLSAGTFAFMIATPIDSTLSFIGPFSRMLQYIRYMKIDYPEKVLLMFKEQKDYFQDFPNKMAPQMLNEFPQHQLPEKFEVYNTPSSFFVNFWSVFFKISVILFVTFVAIIINIYKKKNSDTNALKILIEALKWNLILNFFCSNIGDVVLFTALEMRTLHFSNAAETISFILCVATSVVAIYVVFKILDITWALEKLKTKVAPVEKENGEKWSSCRTLYEPYQNRSYSQQIFLFIFIIRFCLFNLSLGCLFEYPELQASIFVILDISILCFLVIKKPMENFMSLIMEIIFELLILPLNICVFILAIMDRKEMEDYDQRKRIGDVIININLIAPFIAIALLVTKATIICLDLYKQIKARKPSRFNAKAIHPESALNVTHPHNTTRILLPSSSLVDKNLLANSQKLDLEDSPTQSPERSLVSNTRISRIGTLVEKTRKMKSFAYIL